VTRVRTIELRLVALDLVHPFRTSFGEMTRKTCILVALETDGAIGWGECVTSEEPDFSEEFNEAAWLVIRDLLAPMLLAGDDLTARRRCWSRWTASWRKGIDGSS
jgi:O-succinylbenzoate synthase